MTLPLLDVRPDQDPRERKRENEWVARRYERLTVCVECGRDYPSRRRLVNHGRRTGHQIDV